MIELENPWGKKEEWPWDWRNEKLTDEMRLEIVVDFPEYARRASHSWTDMASEGFIAYCKVAEDYFNNAASKGSPSLKADLSDIAREASRVVGLFRSWVGVQRYGDTVVCGDPYYDWMKPCSIDQLDTLWNAVLERLSICMGLGGERGKHPTTTGTEAEPLSDTPQNTGEGEERQKPEEDQSESPLPETAKENVFRNVGDYWTLTFGGETTTIRHSKGMDYLRLLMKRKGKVFTTGEFLSLYVDKDVTLAGGDEILSKEAKEDYGRRLEEICSELETAKDNNDNGQQVRLEKESDDLKAQLLKAAGFAGHGKKLNPEHEKYRISIGTEIVRTIKRIEKKLPKLAGHLTDSIPSPHSGTSLSYRPTKPIEWTT